MKDENATTGHYVRAPGVDNNETIGTKNNLMASEVADDIRNTCYEAFKFSFNNYFSSGIKNLFNGLPDGESYKDIIVSKKISDKLRIFSKIFKDIVTVPVCEDSYSDWWKYEGQLSVLKNGYNIGDIIAAIIKAHCSDHMDDIDTTKWLLYIQGPIGCYKNRLLQYVCLLESAELTLPIFYIDFAKYESGDFNLTKDLDNIKKIIKNYHGAPLFILDNVRGFVCGEQQNVYKSFSDYFNNIECKLIVSRDVEFNRLSNRKYSLPFGRIGSYIKNIYQKGDYANELSISSLNMNRSSEAEEFIQNCIEFFTQVDNCSFNSGGLRRFCKNNKWEYSKLRKYLTKLELFTLDAYQLKKILQIFSHNSNDNVTLSTIYGEYCNELGLTSTDIHESAFKFEYTQDTINFEKVKDWWKIREHKSVLDYIISQYYDEILSNDLNASKIDRKYNLPNVLFPKSVTRFIVPIFENNSSICRYIVDCFDYYKSDIFGNFGRLAQLAFLLGRINSDQAQSALFECLKYVKNCPNPNAKAFLMRSLYVSLIYQGNKEALLLYCNQLIDEDELHKNINIGFHLDYYGDQTYAFVINQIPDYTNETVAKCLNTLRKLSSDLRKRIYSPIKTKESDNMIAILQLITYCQILEKRKYNVNNISAHENFIQDITEFLLEVLYSKKELYLNYMDSAIREYFETILVGIINKHFIKQDTAPANMVTLYNKFSRLYTIGRAGWLKRGLNGYDNYGRKNCQIAESVAEHTFNCWLMGYICLPDTISDNDAGPHRKDDYNKKEILELLLVHDCGEVKTGDIIHKKPEDQEKEMIAIKGLIGNEDVLFKDWMSAWGHGTSSLNADIAYDIDHIQAVYQYFSYYNNSKCKIENCISDWLNELSDHKIKSEIGRQIRQHLILNNEKFIKNVQLFYRFYMFQKSGYKI